MSHRGVFVTGTDTSVGKTWFSSRLIRSLRDHGVNAVGMKPIECGGRDDSTELLASSEGAGLLLDDVNPIWFEKAVAPSVAREGKEISLDDLNKSMHRLAQNDRFVVVEGAGGWMVPIDDQCKVADLAVEMGLPVLVVAANRLGVLNHSILTVEAIKSSGLSCLGIFLNEWEDHTEDISRQSNAEQLREALPDTTVYESGQFDAFVEMIVGAIE